MAVPTRIRLPLWLQNKNDGMKTPKFRIPILSDIREDIDVIVSYTEIYDRSVYTIVKYIKRLFYISMAIAILITAILITLLVR